MQPQIESHDRLLAVAGPYRSGTSCVAGICHRLGFFLGDDLLEAQHVNARGFFESKALQLALQECFDEWRGRVLVDEAVLTDIFGNWLSGCARAERRLAVKHPLLCLVPWCVEQVWPGPVDWIVVHRTPAAAARSLNSLNWHWLPPDRRLADCHRLIEQLAGSIEQHMIGRRHLKVEYSAALADPVQTARRIAEFAGLPTNPGRYRHAAGFVEPSLQHF